jgi:hypothetical protein
MIYNRKTVPSILNFANCALLIAIYRNGKKNAKFMIDHINEACCKPSTKIGEKGGVGHSLGVSKKS